MVTVANPTLVRLKARFEAGAISVQREGRAVSCEELAGVKAADLVSYDITIYGGKLKLLRMPQLDMLRREDTPLERQEHISIFWPCPPASMADNNIWMPPVALSEPAIDVLQNVCRSVNEHLHMFHTAQGC